MNLIPKIAEMLGVEIGEEFKVENDVCLHRFTENGLEYKVCGAWSACARLNLILNGTEKIIKLPYKPKPQERFFFVSTTKPVTVEKAYWSSNNNTIDYALLFCGNVFRTEEEAEKHKAEIYEKLIGKKLGEG